MQGQAKSQTDFRTLSSLNRQPTVRYLACSNRMNKKHDIKRFKFVDFIAFTSVGPTYVTKIGECLRILTTLSTILDQVMVPHVTNYLKCSQRIFPHQLWTSSNYATLMFSQGPYFLAEAALGLPIEKFW